jgi:hypothetical protein
MQFHTKKRGIALLITVMFVMVISVAIGLGLKQINEASTSVKEELFSYQISLLLEDVLAMLQKSNDLKMIGESNNSITDLSLFLEQTQMIPFSTEGIDVMIKVQSARAKFNISDLNDSRKANYLTQYLNKYMINSDYVTILFDVISGIKDDDNYNSAIFEENPFLFRDYLVSYEHLQQINRFYAQAFNDNSLEKVPFKKLFYFGSKSKKNQPYKIDLNYATPEVWEMMLGCTQERAKILANHDDLYEKLVNLDLDTEEITRLKAYNYSFFEPYLHVEVTFLQEDSEAKMSFEYDIRKRKGYNFVYEI